MKINHHIRNNYERLFEILCHQAREQMPNVKSLSDYWLLMYINDKLTSLGLIPYTNEELETIELV
jgi:hypothetical protein